MDKLIQVMRIKERLLTRAGYSQNKVDADLLIKELEPIYKLVMRYAK